MSYKKASDILPEYLLDIENLNVRRIIAMCNPENTPSWKLMERLQMRRKGILLKNIYFKTDKNGNPI